MQDVAMHDPWLIVQPKRRQEHNQSIERVILKIWIAARRVKRQEEQVNPKETTCLYQKSHGMSMFPQTKMPDMKLTSI